jgi:hypothetical protein
MINPFQKIIMDIKKGVFIVPIYTYILCILRSFNNLQTEMKPINYKLDASTLIRNVKSFY